MTKTTNAERLKKYRAKMEQQGFRRLSFYASKELCELIAKERPIFKDTGKPTKYINEALQRLVDIGVVTATQETIGGKPQTVYKMH